MEIEEVETTTLETTIDIVEGTIVEEENFSETIETSHDINITVDNNKEPLDVSLDIEEEYGIAPCFVEVEKCDKIWETMKLIRELQEPPQDLFNDDDDYDNDNTEESLLNDEESNSSSQANPMGPYIKYQPVLGNGNTAVPNFQFSVKSTRALYQCNTCGRQYSHRKTLREHSERIHNIVIPVMRKPKAKNEAIKETKSSLNESFDNNDDKSNHESGSTISSSPSEDKERLLDSASDTQETEPLPTSGKKIPVVCEHCHKVLSDKYYLKVHEALVHGIVGNFSTGTGPLVLRKKLSGMSKITHRCNECGRYFYSIEKLKEHIQILHVPENLDNESNGNKIGMRKQVAVKKTTKSSVKTAAAIAKQIDTPDDNKSRSKSVNATILSRQRLKNKIKLRTCEVCGKVYRNHTNWKIHLIKHHGIVPPGRQRNDPNLNKQHALGMYTCKYCGKGFNWANTLRNHTILQHLKDQVCGLKASKTDKSSQSRVKLAVKNQVQKPIPKLTKVPEQQKRTEQQKPTEQRQRHRCNKCLKTYGSRRSLVFHLANVHGVVFKHVRGPRTYGVSKDFNCDICQEGFQIEKNLAYHELIFHGIRRLEGTNDANPYNRPTQRNLKSRAQAKKLPDKNPPPLIPIRTLRDKERVNYDEETMQNEKSIYKMPKAPENSSKVGTSSQNSEQNDTEPIIQCILCNRHCKKIKRHFIDFHKVRNPDILISQCQLSPLNEPKPAEIKKPPVVKKETIGGLPFKRRRHADSMAKRRVLTAPAPQMTFELTVRLVGGRRRRLYACKLCDFIAHSYEGSKKHSRMQHPEAQIPPLPSVPQVTVKSEIKVEPTVPVIQRRRSESMVTNRKRRRESLDEREIQKRRLSSAFGGESRMTRAVKRLKEELEHKCDICERMFRNADILASHKVSCRARMPVDTGIESNDTRESSDRDSGIGISITIKKKNDSYEIVSRDSSGERPSKRSLAGDGYSDASSSDTRNSLSYSNDLRTVKIRKTDHDDVDMDLEQNLNDQDDDYDIVDAVDDPPPGQILSLADMCKSVLGYTRRVPKLKQEAKQGVQCKICKEYWPSTKSRNTHSWKAHKVSGVEAPIKVGTLRELCVKVLVANGDLEADKKVWYPCHTCSTVWPSVKSRSGHLNGHKYYEALNKVNE